MISVTLHQPPRSIQTCSITNPISNPYPDQWRSLSNTCCQSLIALLSSHPRPDNTPIWSIHRFWIPPNNTRTGLIQYISQIHHYIYFKKHHISEKPSFLYISQKTPKSQFLPLFCIIWKKHIYSKNTHIRKIAIY